MTHDFSDSELEAYMDEALAELLVAGGPLTQSLLGAVRPAHGDGEA